MSFKIRSSLCVMLLFAGAVYSQTQNAPRSEVAGIPVNYDEARVGTYTLPDGPYQSVCFDLKRFRL